MSIQKVTHEEFKQMMISQGHDNNYDVTFQCPACKTLQTGRDIMSALGTESEDEAGKYIGFSCIGRFNNKSTGCDWTLGGLFQIHKLEVITEDGVSHPHFLPMTPEEATKQGDD